MKFPFVIVILSRAVEIRNFEQKFTKITKASAANTPHPHDYY
jgi:hypothetical protein